MGLMHTANLSPMTWSSSKMKLPAVFGRYVLLHRISRGGMGEIFLAKLGEIQGFEKPIIIKKLLPDLSKDREFLQRFVAEAQITIKLSHGNIAQVYEVGMVDGEYFLAMEYVNGRDLRSLASRCLDEKLTLKPDICLLLVREVANALAYAHRRKDETGTSLDLVHCDISPPNVLVSYEGEVKVIDFGIARSAMMRAAESEDVGFGKFGYMAPEQLLRGAKLDRRTDIYSTGVVLHELLTGRRLFNFPPGTSYREVARVVTASRVKPPSDFNPGLDQGLDRLVLRALRTAPEERYQSAEELRDAVQQELYARDPTISTDDLAEVMSRLFSREIEASHQVVSLLSETPLETFEGELTDASTHTVSYALSDLWSGTDAPITITPPPALEPTAPAAPRALRGEPSPTPEAEGLSVEPETSTGAALAGNPKGTRKLSHSEQEVALEPTTGPAPAVTGELPVAAPRQGMASWIWGAILFMSLLGGGVMLGRNLLSSSGPSERGTAPDMAALAAAPSQDAPGPNRSDAAPALAFEPEPVHLSPDAATQLPPKNKPRGKPSTHRKTRRRRPRVSQASIQRKFGQVKREYTRFSRKNGGILDQQWQKILFAYTYGDRTSGSYRKLNGMLDELRQQMKKQQR